MVCPLCGEIEDFCLCGPDIPCKDCPDLIHCTEEMERNCRAYNEWVCEDN